MHTFGHIRHVAIQQRVPMVEGHIFPCGFLNYVNYKGIEIFFFLVLSRNMR